MNISIQKEIAAPQDCKKNLWLISIALVNLLIIGTSFAILILKDNNSFDNKYVTASLFVGIIAAIALTVAVLLRKHHTLMLAVLTLASIDAAALLIYYNATIAKNSLDTVWRLTTIILSFAVLIFTLLFIGIYYAKPRERNIKALSLTKYITYCAMFTALSVICKMIGNVITATFASETLKLTLAYIPWVLGGIVLGPIGGFAAAAIGDFVGQLAVSTGGMPLPTLTISYGLVAVFPAIVYKLARVKNTIHRTWIAIIAGTALSAIFCTLGISTYILHKTYFSSMEFSAYFATRLIQLAVIAINIILMLALSPALVRAKIIKQPVTPFFD